MSGDQSLSVVIPARNAAEHIDRCLRALRIQSGSMTLVVVDAGNDDTASRARHWNATVVSAPDANAAQARNAGVSATFTDLVAFVDADNEVVDGWLAACLDAFSDPAIDAAGQPYRTVDAPTWVQAVYDSLRHRPERRESAEWIGAGNLAVRRRAFAAVGGFDTSLHTCEDVALCSALRSAGFRLVSEPGMRSVHHGDPATLAKLFTAELWRGRDNIRVTFRRPWSFRSIGGLAISAAAVAGLIGAAVGGLLAPWLGPRWLMPGIGVATLAVLARTTLMRVAGSGRANGPGLAATLAVAATYEVARGLALFYPFSHDTRTGAPVVRHGV